MSSRSRVVALSVMALAVGVTSYFVVNGKSKEVVEPSVPVTKESVSTPPDGAKLPERSTSVGFTVDPNVVPKELRLQLPDGTWALALNGVTNPGPLNWPNDRPWAPIVERRVRQDGTEAYVHADGSWSWTQLQYRKDLGRMDSITLLANPTDPLPIDPAEAALNTPRPGDTKK
ncbi:MAG: hypothetical protein AB7I19_07870 [Planctomycetota bacterium]